MFKTVLKRIIGTKSGRDIRRLQTDVDSINQLEAGISKLSDSELKQKTGEFRTRHKEGVSLEELLPEAFAVVRETAKRVLNMRHFDVQLMGGMALHQGKIAEMVTGEGKTLVATLPGYLNALEGKGVHVITVNDYLAKRDRDWMGPVYEFLGLTVGVIQHEISPENRQKAYRCDITFGTNNEFGFDYLRDNMVYNKNQKAQRQLNYAIVDEVDSILIDEARTPLIISGAVDTVTHCYDEVKSLVRDLVVRKQAMVISSKLDDLEKALDADDSEKLKECLFIIHRGSPKEKKFLKHILENASLKKKLDDATLYYGSKGLENEKSRLEDELYFTYEERTREIVFTSKGEDELSKKYADQFQLEDIDDIVFNIREDAGLSDEEKHEKERNAFKSYEEKSRRLNSLETLIKAYVVFKEDVDYVVADNKVTIVDEFTGRMMPGRRYGDGIHEAIEAKENVTIQKESQTLASITFQNYFRMYEKLSGMTGTADTEASEFLEIYKLDVIVVPTNKPLIRLNHPDVIYKTEREKYQAVTREVLECYKNGRPVLLGTTSIDSSERLSRIFKKERIPHEVLNAKYHEREADIIKRAGQKGSLTIATNMAGRGTDIVLGEGVKELGGLHVIGTERHESRRIDNQLRGRSGRQGDAGSNRFYLSLEDDLMRIFGSDRITGVLEKFGMEEGQDIQHPLITRSIATAQRRVETRNFEIRKQLLKYDDIMNKQRTVIYERRNEVLYAEALGEYISDVIYQVVEDHSGEYISANKDSHEWDLEGLNRWLQLKFFVRFKDHEGFHKKTADEVRNEICRLLIDQYHMRENLVGKDQLGDVIRYLILTAIDRKWKDHLYAMDQLRDAVGFRAYGQKDPLVEYQHEGFEMFSIMINQINDEILDHLFRIQFIDKSSQGIPHQNEMNYNDPESVLATNAIRQMAPQSQASQAVAQANPHRSVPTVRRELPKVGRNDPCPCGSGKKYKKCCGQ